MLCGHTDTVGVDGMAAPFDPVERNGRLYGRGAQDMKSGVAAMIDAARLVARTGLRAGRLLVAAVVDEEYASIGADALVARWRADGAVVTEPTNLEVAVAHKGFGGARSKPADGRRTAAGRAKGATRSSAWGGCCMPSRRWTAIFRRANRTRSWAPHRFMRQSLPADAS